MNQGPQSARIQRQHARQRRCHLQMRHTVASDLIGDRACTLITVHDHLEAASQSPKQFQHRDIERNAGDGKPNSGLQPIARSMPVKKLTTFRFSTITPLGLPVSRRCRLRTRGCCLRAGGNACVSCANSRISDIEHRQCRSASSGKLRRVAAVVSSTCILESSMIHEAVPRIMRIQRNIGAAGLQNGQQADNERLRSSHGNAHQCVRHNAQTLQDARQAIGASHRVRDNSAGGPRNHSNRVRRPRRLLREQFSDGARADNRLPSIPLKH